MKLHRDLELGITRLTPADVVAVARHGASATIGAECRAQLDAARAMLERWSQDDRAVYGLTRGLGNRATTTIPVEERAGFSEAALQSRATGGGGYLPTDVARAALFVRAATLARGGAGVRPAIIETQLAMLARGVTPLVPRIGSVGASDLLLCANLGLPIIGAGRAETNGIVMTGADAMAQAGIETLTLSEKEGLALCSSNAVSIGMAALVLGDVADLLDLADAVLAMTFEAFAGNPSPIDPRIAAARPVPEQERAAASLRAMLHGSALFDSGVPRRIQDPISLRCATQVHAAVRMTLGWAADIVEIELNSASDNPLILVDDDEIVSTGNFHTVALSVAFDALRLSLAQFGTMSSERCARLTQPEMSGLPSRLTRHGVTRSGVGLVPLVARTLSREARHCSQPVSNDDITPMGVEDQAPFTLVAVRRAAEQVDLLLQVLACEALVAAQAIDLRPLEKSAPVVSALHRFVREHVAFVDDDRSTTEDIERLTATLRDGRMLGCIRAPV